MFTVLQTATLIVYGTCVKFDTTTAPKLTKSDGEVNIASLAAMLAMENPVR